MGGGGTAPVPGTADFGSSTPQRPASEPPKPAPAGEDDDFKIERF